MNNGLVRNVAAAAALGLSAALSPSGSAGVADARVGQASHALPASDTASQRSRVTAGTLNTGTTRTAVPQRVNVFSRIPLGALAPSGACRVKRGDIQGLNAYATRTPWNFKRDLIQAFITPRSEKLYGPDNLIADYFVFSHTQPDMKPGAPNSYTTLVRADRTALLKIFWERREGFWRGNKVIPASCVISISPIRHLSRVGSRVGTVSVAKSRVRPNQVMKLQHIDGPTSLGFSTTKATNSSLVASGNSSGAILPELMAGVQDAAGPETANVKMAGSETAGLGILTL